VGTFNKRDMESVELLRRQYLQLLDPEELAFPGPSLLRLPDVQARIYETMFEESKLQYAPPERYRFRVLKRLVKALEQSIEDPEEDVGAPIRPLYYCVYLNPVSPLSQSGLAIAESISFTDASILQLRRKSQMTYPLA